MVPIYLGPLNFSFWRNFASKKLEELFFCKLKPVYVLYNNRFRKTFFENHSIIVVAFSLTVCYIIFHRLISNSNREKEDTIQRQASLVQSHEETIQRLNRDLVIIRNDLAETLRLKAIALQDRAIAIQARDLARQTIRQGFLLEQTEGLRIGIGKIEALIGRLRGYNPKSPSTPDLRQNIAEVIQALNMIKELYRG
jgi:hypothetical protein